MAELEKLGSKYRVALRLTKEPRFLRMPGYLDKGKYADDDILAVAKQHRCFIVCTNDKDLRRRLRKVPGVRIAFVMQARSTSIAWARRWGRRGRERGRT
jgi:U3 small nucleolar RNA-associated protein 24